MFSEAFCRACYTRHSKWIQTVYWDDHRDERVLRCSGCDRIVMRLSGGGAGGR